MKLWEPRLFRFFLVNTYEQRPIAPQDNYDEVSGSLLTTSPLPLKMSLISFSECLIREYAVAAFQDVYILNDHGLFEGDDILGQNSTEDLYDEDYTPSGQKSKPIVHIPVCRL